MKLPAWLLVALGLGLGAEALVADASGNPYLGITGSNVFRLKAPQPRPRTAALRHCPESSWLASRPFGDKRALLKVYLPANPPEPAKEVSCILTVGQREGPIEVLEIDEVAGSVKVNNSGTVMVLTFEKESPRPQAAPPLPPLGMGQ